MPCQCKNNSHGIYCQSGLGPQIPEEFKLLKSEIMEVATLRAENKILREVVESLRSFDKDFKCECCAYATKAIRQALEKAKK